MSLNSLVGERIRQAIVKGGYANFDAFTSYTKIPKSSLNEILNGKNDPRVSTLARIAAGLKISIAELMKDSAIDSWVSGKALREPAAKKKVKNVRKGTQDK